MQIKQERREEILKAFKEMIETEIVRGEQFKTYYEAKIKVQDEKEAAQTKLKLKQAEDAIAFNTEFLTHIK